MRHFVVSYPEEMRTALNLATPAHYFPEIGVCMHFCDGMTEGILISRCLSRFARFCVVRATIAGGIVAMIKKAEDDSDLGRLFRACKDCTGDFFVSSHIVQEPLQYRLESSPRDLTTLLWLRDNRKCEASAMLLEKLYLCHEVFIAQNLRCLQSMMRDLLMLTATDSTFAGQCTLSTQY